MQHSWPKRMEVSPTSPMLITRLKMASTTQAAEQLESTADLQQAQEEVSNSTQLAEDWHQTTMQWGSSPQQDYQVLLGAKWDSLILRDGLLYWRWESPAGQSIVLQLHDGTQEAPEGNFPTAPWFPFHWTFWSDQNARKNQRAFLQGQVLWRCFRWTLSHCMPPP